MRSKHVILTSLKIFGHSKICEFIHPFIVQNICRFDVSVNNVEIDHFLATFEDLKHNLNGFLLTLRFIDALHFEIGLAMFHDQINAVLFIDDFKQFDYIFMINISKNANLVL